MVKWPVRVRGTGRRTALFQVIQALTGADVVLHADNTQLQSDRTAGGPEPAQGPVPVTSEYVILRRREPGY